MYRIRGVEYAVTGRTRADALARILEFREGKTFNSYGDLKVYVEGKIRELHNLRSLEPTETTIRYTPGLPGEDGIIPVDLEVVAADTRNFIILPEPKYDSNSGFTLSLKARDYNFLGTLTPLRFDLIWGDDEDGKQMAGFLLDSDFPFRALGYNWNVNFDHDFRYYFDAPVYYKNTTGVSMELPAGTTAFTFGYEQGLVIHEKDGEAKNDGGYHSWYMYSRLYGDWEIPVPLGPGFPGELSYIPGIYGNINYRPGGDLGDYRRGPNAGFNQRLEWGGIDWIGNFRQGFKAGVFTAADYNFFHRDWDSSLGLYGEGHVILSPFFGISGRLLYTLWLDDSYDLAGDVIRGYKDNQLEAKQRISLNLDFPFRLIRFVPSEWSGNKKFRFFDFEQHWSPFIDFMMADAGKAASFEGGGIITAMGMEIITFPLTWRSIYLRISAGWNMREWFRTGSPPGGIYREIYIGLGHFY